VSEGHNFLSVMKELGEQSDLAKRASERLPEDLWGEVRTRLRDPKFKEWLRTGTGKSTFSFVSSYVSPSFLGVVQGTKNVLFLLVEVLVILLYIFFILLDYPKLISSAKQSVPKPLRANVSLFVAEFDEALSRYFRAQALVAAIVGVLFAFGFSLVGLPMPWLLGLMMGVLNLVPYLQLLGVIPVAFLSLVTALQGDASFLNVGLSSLAVLLVVQALQDMLIVPKVMGQASGLSPAVMLLSLTIWGQLLGFLGLILAIPITCLSLVWYHRLFVHDEKTEVSL
jgi:predicted PurR-regulated permease PerM